MDLGARPTDATVPHSLPRSAPRLRKRGQGLPSEAEVIMHHRSVKERLLGSIIQGQEQP